MVYRVMVTSYGFADIEADSAEKALSMVDDMDNSDFDWNNDFSSEDAEIVDEFNSYN